MNIPKTAAVGFALGLAWGAAARVWMRLISTEPEFSWTGTGLILGFCAGGGLILGFLAGARAAGWSRWWRMLGLLCLVIFAGPGMVFLPAYLLGGLLFRRQVSLVLAGAGAVLGGVAFLWVANQQEPAPVDGLTMYGGFLVLSLALTIGSAEFYRPRRRRTAPRERQLPVGL
ncbi:hypothetical protein EV138_3269 [Kribbella voronezhensis]|uniref:Uncharacterized protein n=1 Tax=Kribbella voronezhensis TaxID=2512212 RepID=A0A4R7TC93_9ACTN|nr:hypothetical protein [Kribbella voronezhensis]TDU89694.1 hypothetical protein EV138_3269 [Kribbella voronezhensis]